MVIDEDMMEIHGDIVEIDRDITVLNGDIMEIYAN